MLRRESCLLWRPWRGAFRPSQDARTSQIYMHVATSMIESVRSPLDNLECPPPAAQLAPGAAATNHSLK